MEEQPGLSAQALGSGSSDTRPTTRVSIVETRELSQHTRHVGADKAAAGQIRPHRARGREGAV